MKRIIPVLLMLGLLPALPALAQVPQTMSYQGVLTDAAGNIVPDGFYDLTFRIYDASSVLIYTEAHTGAINHVRVVRGGFSVVIGSISPLSLPFDGACSLGIQVAADPELAPRIPLASSPYALGLRLPFYCSVSAGHTLISGADYGGFGGSLHLFDESGAATFRFEPDVDGTGGYLDVGNTFVVDGNADGLGNPSAYFSGVSSAIFNMTTTGDASVQLPASSVDATETLDEPGVSQGHVNGSVNVSIGAMADIVTTTINTPAPGYIVVEADGQHGIGGSASATFNYAACQIDETAGGAPDGSHYQDSGFSGAVGARNFFTWSPVSIRRTYFKAAGTYTFRLEAIGSQNEVLSNYFWNPTITATYYPTGYGTVTTAPAMAERGEFSSVQHTVSAANGPNGASTEGELVDLRELELRAAKTAADAERAQRVLLEARARNQSNAARVAPVKQ